MIISYRFIAFLILFTQMSGRIWSEDLTAEILLLRRDLAVVRSVSMLYVLGEDGYAEELHFEKNDLLPKNDGERVTVVGRSALVEFNLKNGLFVGGRCKSMPLIWPKIQADDDSIVRQLGILNELGHGKFNCTFNISKASLSAASDFVTVPRVHGQLSFYDEWMRVYFVENAGKKSIGCVRSSFNVELSVDNLEENKQILPLPTQSSIILAFNQTEMAELKGRRIEGDWVVDSLKIPSTPYLLHKNSGLSKGDWIDGDIRGDLALGFPCTFKAKKAGRAISVLIYLDAITGLVIGGKISGQ